MAERWKLEVKSGQIVGYAAEFGRNDGIHVRWTVPALQPNSEAVRHFVRELAYDPIFAGRWNAGKMMDTDRQRARISEGGWQSFCNCGSSQPCRHAYTLLYRFRQEAGSNGWLWFEAFGLKKADLLSAVRRVRSAFVEKDEDEDEWISARAIALVEAAEKERPYDGVIPWALRNRGDPAFWNRDVSFTDWLSPLMEAILRNKEDDHESKGHNPLDPDIR